MTANPALRYPEHPTPHSLHDLGDRLDRVELPTPAVEVAWHGCDDETIARIVAAFPDVKWTATSSSGFDWVQAAIPGARLTAFAATEPESTTPRLGSLLGGAA